MTVREVSRSLPPHQHSVGNVVVHRNTLGWLSQQFYRGMLRSLINLLSSISVPSAVIASYINLGHSSSADLSYCLQVAYHGPTYVGLVGPCSLESNSSNRPDQRLLTVSLLTSCSVFLARALPRAKANWFSVYCGEFPVMHRNGWLGVKH